MTRAAPASWSSQNHHGMGRKPSLAGRSGSRGRSAQLMRSARQVARESVRLGAISAALPAASAVTVARRLPIPVGLSSASALWQSAEVWRMTLEKPVAFWQAWLALGPLPWQLWNIWAAAMVPGRVQPELALRLTPCGGAWRRGTPGWSATHDVSTGAPSPGAARAEREPHGLLTATSCRAAPSRCPSLPTGRSGVPHSVEHLPSIWCLPGQVRPVVERNTS